MRLLPPDASAGLPPLRAIQAALARRSLADFVKGAWHVLEPSTPLRWNWHIEAICDHVQALFEGRIPLRNLLVLVPPGSMKSLIASVFAPAWWWIDHPEWRGIFASANPRVSVRDSMKCRDLICSAWYQEAFTPKWRLTGDQNTKLLFKNTSRGYRQALSAGAKVTGDRGDGLFWDDLLDAADAPSQAERERIILWYDQAFHNRIANPHTGIRCGIMQRLHEVDPPGHVIAGGDYEVLCIPQEYEPPKDGARKLSSIGWTDPRTEAGALMFPEFFSEVYLAKERRRLGPSTGYAAQHNQTPAPAAGVLFKRDWWRFYTLPQGHENMTGAQLRMALGVRRMASGWDTALGEKRENDYTSNHVIGQTESRYLVLSHWKDKVPFPVTKRLMQTNHDRWGAEGVPIEGGGSASGKAAVQSLRADSLVPAIEVPNIAKEVRAALVAPTLEANMVYLPEGEPWVDGFIESMAKFPRGAHDDDVDSFCIALHWLLYGDSALGLFDYYRDAAAAQGGAQPLDRMAQAEQERNDAPAVIQGGVRTL